MANNKKTDVIYSRLFLSGSIIIPDNKTNAIKKRNGNTYCGNLSCGKKFEKFSFM
jgi:hypothetical protein